jgi:uncharacterized damage-inducible protein DinB
MDTMAQTYLDKIDQLRGKIIAAVQDMGQEELSWTSPAADSNSPYVLATHIIGTEREWIHHMVGGYEVFRDRDAEFLATGDDPAALVKMLEQNAATSREVISKLTIADMDQPRARPARLGGTLITLHYCLMHMVEHLAEHVGHIELTKQMYAKR